MADDFDPIIEEMKRERESQRVRQNLSGAFGTNPDKQAEINRLSEKTNVPAFSVASPENEAWVKNLSRMKDIDPDGLVKSHPMTAKALTDEQFAKIAHDDVENLKGLEDAYSIIGRRQQSTIEKYARSTVAGLGTSIGMGIQGLGNYGKTVSQAVDESGMGGQSESMQRFSFFSRVAGIGLEQLGTVVRKGYEAVDVKPEDKTFGMKVAGGIGQIGGQILTYLATGGTGAVGLNVGVGIQQQADTLDNANVTDTDTRLAAMTAGGAVTGALESAQLAVILKGVPGINRILSKLPEEGISSLVKNKVGQTSIDIGAAGATEYFQEFAENLAHNVIQMTYDDQAEIMDGLYEDATVAGATGALARSMILTITGIGKRLQTQEDAAQKKQDIENLHNAAMNVKTMQRDPAAIRAMIEAANPEARVYVDGGIASKFFQEIDDQTRQRLTEVIPDIAERIQEANLSGGDVMLNRSDYVAYIASTEGGRVLMEHVKFDVDDMTIAQLSDPEYLADFYESEGQESGGQSDIQAFEERLMSELRASGRIGTQSIARESVAPLAAFIQTMRESGDSEAVTQSLLQGIEVQGPARPPSTSLDLTDKTINDMREYVKRIETLQSAREKSLQTRREKAKAKAQAEGRTYEEPKLPKAGKAKNLPVLKYIAKLGGVKPDSYLARELKAMDVTPKSAPWLFKKDGIEGIDTIEAAGINSAIGEDVFQNMGTNERDTDGYYVDPADLLAAIDSELRGSPVVSNADPMEAAYEDFSRYLFELGLDLDTATNDQIKEALKNPSQFLGNDPALDAEVDADGVSYNQAGEVITDSKAFRDWFGDSKVVDADGKPLVVYHGTREIFEAFDLNKLGRNGMALGAGFYFTNSKELAGGYGDTMEVYLSAKNPTFSIEKKTITKAQVKKIIIALEKIEPEFLSNYGDVSFEGYNKILNSAIEDIYDASNNDADVITTIINVGGIDRNYVMKEVIKYTGKDGFIVSASIAAIGAGKNDKVYTVLLPEQIKSVNNRGTFDPNDPRILYQSETLQELENRVVALGDDAGASLGSGGVKLDISENNNVITVGRIFVPADMRNKGLGSKIMNELITYADRNQKRLALSPSSDFGGNKSKLEKWYKRLGFKSNKGRSGDMAISETMVREPVKKLEQKNRGQVSIMRDGRYIVKLFETSNLSTFLHETGHIFLDALHRYAMADGASDRTKQIYADTLKALNVKSYSEIGVKQHEMFAREYEKYLMTGDAPSVGLQAAFRKFTAWLKRIYMNITGMDSPVNPELKAVFDRMLATDAEIAQVQGKNDGFQINKDLLAILPKADQERYERLHNNALEEAKEALLKKTLKQKEREQTQWWKEERLKLREQMEQQVNTDPVYRAMEFLTKGKYLAGDDWVDMPPVKINRKDAEKALGKTIMAKLPKTMFSKNGISADAFSELIGYVVGNGQEGFRNGTGQELLFAMANAEDRKARIERLTREGMVERHGDLMTDGSIENAAIEAFHVDAQALKMEMEGKATAKLAGLPFGSNTNFELAAQKILSGKNIRDATNVRRHYVASVRAAKAYGKALRSKNYAVAVKAKQQQLLSHHLYLQALQARREFEKSIKSWDRLKKTDEKLSKSMDMNYVYVARAILGRYGVLPYNPTNLQTYFSNIQETDPEAFEDLVLAVQENTRNVPEAVQKGTGTYQPWTQLTLEEFRGLKDTIDNVLGVGRNQKTMTIDGQKIERQAVIQELDERLARLPATSIADGAQKALEWHDRGKLAISSIRAGMRRVESWSNVMDGQYGGVFRKYIWNPINDARGNYRVARAEYLEKMAVLLKPHADRLNDSGKIIGYEIGGYEFSSKAELIGMLLHTGNESNFDKLWRGARGKGQWDPAALQAMIKRMMDDGTITKEDMDLVQGMWDLVNSLKPQAQAAHKAMYGYYFSEVTAWPVQTPWGEYKGGYWPAIADNHLSQDARIRQDKEDLITQNNASMFPTTGRGFTKSRSEGYAAPLSFDLKLLSGHVDKVLRFVHLEPAVKDVAKLVNDKGFRKTMERVDPRAIESMIIPWLQRVARQTVEVNDSKWMKEAQPISRFLRASASAQAMMLNLLNAVQQLTGFSQAAYVIGARNLGRSFVQYMKNPQAAHEMINEASPFMRYRSTLVAENLQRTVVDILLNRTKFAKVRDAAQTHGYIFQRVFQNWVDGTTWMGAYDKATSEGMTEKEAVRYADSVVRDTQGSTEAEDISGFEAGSANARLFTMFYSYFNTQANLILTEVQNISRKSTGTDKAAKLGYLYLMLYALPSFMAELLVRSLRDDLPEDEDDDGTVLDDWLAWFAGSQARYATAMVPFVGQVINGIINSTDDKPFNDRVSLSPVVSMTETIIRTPKSIYDAVTGDGDASRAVQNTLTSVGFATGLPLGQLGKPIGYGVDVMEGDTDPENIGDVARGIIAGPPPADKR